jgi:hypothetical protein
LKIKLLYFVAISLRVEKTRSGDAWEPISVRDAEGGETTPSFGHPSNVRRGETTPSFGLFFCF